MWVALARAGPIRESRCSVAAGSIILRSCLVEAGRDSSVPLMSSPLAQWNAVGVKEIVDEFRAP